MKFCKLSLTPWNYILDCECKMTYCFVLTTMRVSHEEHRLCHPCLVPVQNSRLGTNSLFVFLGSMIIQVTTLLESRPVDNIEMGKNYFFQLLIANQTFFDFLFNFRMPLMAAEASPWVVNFCDLWSCSSGAQ